MLNNIWNFLEKTMNEFKDFIIANHSNPFLWLGLFIGGILLFTITYNALTKHN